MGLPRFTRALGKPVRELIVHARYDEDTGSGESASVYFNYCIASNTPKNAAWRPFTIDKPGWVFIVALILASDYTNTTPAQYWVELYRDNTLLDSYTWEQTSTGQHGTRRIVLYGWEYLTPGDYTAYIKGKSNSDVNYVKMLTLIEGGNSFPGNYFPYLISVSQITLK